MTPPRADQILTSSCPSLTHDFRRELLEGLAISAPEAARINALVREWGLEPNNRQTADQRQAELRDRILKALRAFECGSCGAAMRGPFVVDAAAREICKACADAKPAPCLLCKAPTSPDDRLDFQNGKDAGVAHFDCIGRAQRAFGWERSSMLVRRSGPAFRAKVRA